MFLLTCCGFIIVQNNGLGDFPGGPTVKNLSSSAEDESSIPGQVTKIPHATGQLNPLGKTTEPITREAPALREQSLSHWTSRELLVLYF